MTCDTVGLLSIGKAIALSEMEDWDVEVTVEGFGPNHPLWKRFAEVANRLPDSTVRWNLAQPTDRGGQTARIRGLVAADSATAATRRVMAVVHGVGRAMAQ